MAEKKPPQPTPPQRRPEPKPLIEKVKGGKDTEFRESVRDHRTVAPRVPVPPDPKKK